MALKTYERKDSIEQAKVVSGSGYRAAADAWGEVGKAARITGELAAQEGVKRAEVAGESEGDKAVWVDPDTNTPHMVGTLPEGTRPYAVAYRKAAEARYQAELGLSSMAKAAELGNTHAMNPEGFRNSWAGYMKGITESVPESIRPGTDLLLKQMGTKKYYELQSQDYERTRNEAKVATLNLMDTFERDTVDTLRKSGLAGGSPEYLQAKTTQVESLINDQVKAGVISPEEGNNRIKDFKFRMMRGMISGEAIKMATSGNAKGVDKFLDEFKRTPSQEIDDYQRDQIASFAKGEVATEMAKAKADASAAMDAAKKQVKGAQETWWKGESYALDDQQVLRIAEATGDAELIADTQAALTARTVMKEFSVLSPQDQEAQINALKQPGQEQTPDTLKLREKLETVYSQTASAIDSGDTLQLATSRGLIKVDPLDPTNPATMQKRAADVIKVDQAMGAESNPLMPVEKDHFIKLFDGLDSEGKIALYGTMKKDMSEDLALRAMRQLGQERPAMAMAMAVSDDAPEVARQILMGDLALQADKNVLGGSEEYPGEFQSYVGTAIQGDDTLRNAIFQSALAVHADMKKRNPELSTTDFSKAIDIVTGGIAEYNGFKTIVPKRGMTEGDFEDLIDGLTDEQFRQAAGNRKLVTLTGQEVSADLIHSRANLEWIGDGQYILKLNISDSLSGQTVFLADDKGQVIKDQWGRPVPAELNLKSFVGE